MKKVYLTIFTFICLFSFYITCYADDKDKKFEQYGCNEATNECVPYEYCEVVDTDSVRLSTTFQVNESVTFFPSYVTYQKFECIKHNPKALVKCRRGDDSWADVEINCSAVPEKTNPDTSGNSNNNSNKNPNKPSSNVLKDFCNVDKNPELMRTFKGAGYILYALKIIIPILLIILGSIDIFQAVISQDEKQLSKSIMKLVQRVIAGVIIFFIPTIINYVFDMVDTNATSRYQGCYECLLDYHNCPEIPKIGG